MTENPPAQKPTVGRFVVLEHDHPELHWDFMLEIDGALRTWRLPRPPGTTDVMDAIALPDHRWAYLDYEGPVSGDRGNVKRWDQGQFEWMAQSPTIVAVRLHGERWRGIVEFHLEDAANWRSIWLAATR